MASEKQIAANRRNAQKSTGPRTQAGKAISRMNAFRSGIHSENLVIRGEWPDELETLTEEYHREFQPATPCERDLVDAIVRNEWISRRMSLIEAELWGHHYQTAAATRPNNRFDVLDRHWPLGQGFVALSRDLERLQRRVSALERSTRQAIRELDELRARRTSEPEADPDALTEEPGAVEEELTAVEDPTHTPQPAEAEPTSGQIGFVPSTLSPDSPSPLTPTPWPAAPAQAVVLPTV
ncbi:MAG TPA: hypothetical protein VKX45_12035 [Bryobacteraceae bacterium]|jgi:hypothetical protein|nr:hypothetical protein [Bryobacteraceae bacterium]